MPSTMRKAEREAYYKSIKKRMVKDPDITDKQYTENTPIGYKKVAELRREVEG